MSRWPPGGEFQARTKPTFKKKKKGPEGGGQSAQDRAGMVSRAGAPL